MIRMPWWRFLRSVRAGRRREPAPTEAQARDERLSAYIDGDRDATETPALQSELAESPELRSAMEGMREVRDALAALGEVRAPRPFALTEPPAPVASRLELATRFGAAMTAVLLTVAIIGDVTTGGVVSEPLEAPVAARAELAAAPAEGDEAEKGAQAAAAAAPTAPPTQSGDSLAAPASAPTAPTFAVPTAAAATPPREATSEPERPGVETAPAEATRPPAPAPAGQTPAAAPEPQIAADEAAGTDAGSDAVRALELWLGAATVILALLAAAQWDRRRRSR